MTPATEPVEWWDMAELWWSATGYEVSPAAVNISAVEEATAAALTQNGWVGFTATSLSGSKPGIDFFAGIMFLPISGANFWQVIAIGGDGTEAQGLAELENIQNTIAGLKFL